MMDIEKCIEAFQFFGLKLTFGAYWRDALGNAIQETQKDQSKTPKYKPHSACAVGAYWMLDKDFSLLDHAGFTFGFDGALPLDETFLAPQDLEAVEYKRNYLEGVAVRKALLAAGVEVAEY